MTYCRNNLRNCLSNLLNLKLCLKLKKRNKSTIIHSQQRVVLAPPNNQIFPMHLHHLIAIFTSSYYYIYNDFSSIIYRCNLGITPIYAKFFKKNYKFFLWILIPRNICQIVHKCHQIIHKFQIRQA
jgi:hypothetical protein